MGGDVWFTLTEDIRLDLLELMGRGYVIDHCIASLRKRNRDIEYRVYITDALKAIVGNTARFAGGVELSRRYADYLMPHKKNLTPSEVKAKIKGKIGGKISGRNGLDGQNRP